jgi:hypothetical protein
MYRGKRADLGSSLTRSISLAMDACMGGARVFNSGIKKISDPLEKGEIPEISLNFLKKSVKFHSNSKVFEDIIGLRDL